MVLKELSLINFKSYQQIDLLLHPRMNCFVGNNGQGKTNLLDAIYYLSMCKSSLNPIDSQNINHREQFFVVQGLYERLGEDENIYCAVKRNEPKVFRRNGKEYQRLADHVGFIPVVSISPADSSLVTEGSEERRKFINTVVSQYDKGYLDTLMQYNKLLASRNRLLKELGTRGGSQLDLLEVLDEQMSALATPIFEKRLEFATLLTPYFQRYYSQISGGAEEVSVEYSSSMGSETLSVQLERARERDRVLQYTTVGIHKDDLVFKFKGQTLKREASQGQQKSYLIALKLAQFSYMCSMMPVKPLLLLDDIFDKFDPHRVQQFISLVAHNGFGQIFITDANKSRLNGILEQIGAEHTLFRVENGEAIPLENDNE